VLTVSSYSRGEIIEWSGLPEERVVNVGNGVGVPFCPWGDSYQPGFPYILYVGSFRPHKNVQRLLRAFRDIDYPEVRLVVVGPRRPSLTAYLDELGIGSRTVVLGQLTDEELARVYRGALLLAQPSLIEGFGLPALEAMACGTPAVVSRTTALPEVCGSAGVYVDPLDTREIQKALERVLGDGELRARLRNLGIQRARAFSWDRVAATVRALLEGAAAGNQPRRSVAEAAHR
jgi:glycosyltransferase involved in cell wall biosynthesis